MLLTFVFLALSVCAVWMPSIAVRSGVFIPPWALLFLAATLSGLHSSILSWPALPVLALLVFACEVPRHVANSLTRAVMTITAGLIALGLALHLFPGFNNPIVLNGVRTSPEAVPFTQYANFDKATAGLVLLAFFCRRLKSVDDARKTALPALSAGLLTMIVLIGTGLAVHHIAVDPKFPTYTFVFLAVNLLFTCAAEEAFFRGLIQEKLTKALSSGWQWLAVAASSLFFGLVHLPAGIVHALLATILGIGCSVAYARTRRVEAPILVHFSFNAIHFLGFTYPFLQQ